MCIPAGHHPYVAHYLGVESRIAFTKKVADVYSFITSRTITYQLDIPFHPDMPSHYGLFSKKAIRWYLRHGFAPALIGRKITFCKVGGLGAQKQAHLNTILSLCDKVEAEYPQPVHDLLDDLEESFATINLEDEPEEQVLPPQPVVENTELIRQLLVLFKLNLEKGDHYFARECIQKAYELHPRSRPLKELYAEYLLYSNDSSAAALFIDLSQGKDEEQVVACLEKALEADPTNSDIVTKLLYETKSISRKLNHCLYAFLQSWKIDQVKAESFYKKALWINPQDPFIFLSRLNSLPSGQKKEDLYRILADIFKKRGDDLVAKHYLAKVPGGIQQYIYEKPRQKPKQAKELVVTIPIRTKNCPSLCSLLYQELPGEGFVVEPEHMRAASKEVKDSYVDFIDQHIKKGEDSQAEEAIAQAMTRCGRRASFLKRLYRVCSEREQQGALLHELWDVYTKKASMAKAEVVARLIYAHTHTFECGWRLATCHAMQGKVRESAHGFFALAIAELQSGRYDAVSRCLEKIEAIDHTYAAFSPEKRKIVYLMHLACRIAKNEGFGVEQAYEKLAFAPSKTVCVSRNTVTGFCAAGHEARLWFAVDHPLYVACYSDFDKRILFTLTTAELTYSHKGNKETFVLQVPSCDDLPDEVRLFEQKTILWYLQEGFLPVVIDNAITFISPAKAFLHGALARQLDICLQTVQHSSSQLQQIKKCFEREQHALALALLHNMKDIHCKKLYAEYLAFCKSPQALPLFFELSRETRGSESCGFLQKAFLLDPLNEAVYERIVERRPPTSQLLTLCLFAYVHFMQKNPAKANLFYIKAMNLDVHDPFMHFAHLQCIVRADKVQKMKAYAGLADVFRAKEVREYYLRKKQIINCMVTVEGAKQFFASESAKILAANADACQVMLSLEVLARQLLDALLEDHAYEIAQELLAAILRVFQQRFAISHYARTISEDDRRYDGEGDLFALREIEVYSHLGNNEMLAYVCKRLQAMYQLQSQFDKALCVGRLTYARCRTLESTNDLAKLYHSMGRPRRATELYVDNALWCARNKFFVNAQGCIDQLHALDTEGIYVTDDEKAMIMIITSIAKLPAVVERF